MQTSDELSRRIARATFATRLLVIVGLLLLAAILYFLVDLSRDTNQIVTGVETQQDTNTATIDSSEQTLVSSERTLDLIESCTTPGRECFERGQERTADAVANINRAAVYAAACADQEGVQGADEIYACVIRQLAERGDN